MSHSFPTRRSSDLPAPLQPRHQPVVYVLMDEETPERRAALAGGAHGSEGDSALGEVEIRRGSDDHAVVAAELEQRAAEAGGDARPDLAAHARRASGEIGRAHV